MKRAILLLPLLASIISCNLDTTTVVQTESRLTIASLFAINDADRVTLGWTPPHPPFIFKAAAHDHPGGGDPGDAGTPARVLIYRGDHAEFTLSRATLLGTVPGDVNRYVDTTVRNGEIHYYRAVPVGITESGVEKMGAPTEAAVGQPYDYSAVTAIRYSEHVDRIFASSCAVGGCHVGSGTNHGDDGHPDANLKATTDIASAGQFSLKNWQDLMKGGSHGSVVVAYKPTKSHLLFHINNDTTLAPVSTPHMPLPGFQLPADQVRLISRWIAGGCQDDQGSIPFSNYPGGRVLVTVQAEDLVAVIDRGSNLIGRYVRAGAENVFTTAPEAPHNVTIDEARGWYYVNLIGAGKVLKYRLDTNEKIDEVGGIISPTQVALSSTGDTAYVAQFAAGVNAVKIIRTNPMQVIGEIAAGNVDKPHGVQITPDGRELWVTGNLSDNILVADFTDFSTRLIQLNNQPPGQGGVLLPYQTVMTADNQKVYVTCQRGNVVVVVDRRTDEVVKTIPVGLNPLIPAITPDSRYVLVPNRNSDDLSVIDTQTDSVSMTIANIGPQPHGSAVTPDGRLAYISCENVSAAVPPHHPTAGSRVPGYFTVVDLATMSVTRRYELGAFAAGVAITDR